MIVQFDRGLSQEETAALRARGVNPLSFLYKRAWLCAADPAAFSKPVVDQYSIAAVSPWKPEYKISAKTMQGQFEEWAVTEKGEVKLLVTFFGDVPKSEMERIAKRYSSTAEIFSEPNIWALQVSPK